MKLFCSISGVWRARGRRYNFPTCSVICWQIFILCSDTEDSTSTPWCRVLITRNKITAVPNLNNRRFNILHRLFSHDEGYHGTFLHEMRMSMYYYYHYHPHTPPPNILSFYIRNVTKWSWVRSSRVSSKLNFGKIAI